MTKYLIIGVSNLLFSFSFSFSLAFALPVLVTVLSFHRNDANMTSKTVFLMERIFKLWDRFIIVKINQVLEPPRRVTNCVLVMDPFWGCSSADMTRNRGRS